jgi:hypothetical protein
MSLITPHTAALMHMAHRRIWAHMARRGRARLVPFGVMPKVPLKPIRARALDYMKTGKVMKVSSCPDMRSRIV